MIALGLPFVTERYRSALQQYKLYKHGRSAQESIMAYKRVGESKHNALPSWTLDLALLLADGKVSWFISLLDEFARLMKAAEVQVH